MYVFLPLRFTLSRVRQCPFVPKIQKVRVDFVLKYCGLKFTKVGVGRFAPTPTVKKIAHPLPPGVSSLKRVLKLSSKREPCTDD